jgi:hypothetical protein
MFSLSEKVRPVPQMSDTIYFLWNIYWKEAIQARKNEDNFKINLTVTMCTRLEMHAYEIEISSIIKWLWNIKTDNKDRIPKRELLDTAGSNWSKEQRIYKKRTENTSLNGNNIQIQTEQKRTCLRTKMGNITTTIFKLGCKTQRYK